ncbi:DUF5994 family protein [Amycolatopsis sp. NPDC051758]|uniref:DUF5994 family protein n=1 Tax=Amycolatopsis sp. NPDC051758 TaxID=3363935 RepID=UPI00378E2A31
MPSGPKTSSSSAPATEPRLRLKPAGPTTGHVDGGWWPRTRDLDAELPALLTEVAARIGRIDRVTYHLADWPAPDRRLTFDGHVVRLEGFRSQQPGHLTVIGWDRDRLTLQVVSPETTSDDAEHALASAADPDENEAGAQPLAAREADGVPQPV